MILKRLKVNVGNMLGINSYIIQDEETKEAMVIDPGGSIDKIVEMLTVLDAKVKYIVLTHCHGDHISGVNELRDRVGGKVLIHRFDQPGLSDSELNMSIHIGVGPIVVKEDARVDDGDLLHIGKIEFRVIHTPGHTRGGICLYCEKEGLLFSGDTMFKGIWGRTDLPTASFEEIIDSITNKLMLLPNDVIVYPGHGRMTRIGDEKQIYLNLQPQNN